MHDSFSRIAAEANRKAGYLKQADLDQIKGIIAGLNKRLDAVKALSTISSCCVSDAISGIICEDPSLAEVGGACYPNRKMAACLRDSEIILRYVCYALMAGDISVLEDRCLKGLKETYAALNISLPAMVRAINLMKTICVAHIQNFNATNGHASTQAVTQGDCSDLASECALYFERVITAILAG